ncbi:unnamed protein product [Rotaria magnacalcarata]
MQQGNMSDQQLIMSSSLAMDEILDDVWKDEESFMSKFYPSALLKSQDFDKRLDEDRSQIVCLYLLTNAENRHNVVTTDLSKDFCKIFDNKSELFHSISDDVKNKNQRIKQKLISEFENEFSSANAIRRYARDSLIYRLLNKSLRSRNINRIFKFRFLIELQKQLEYNFDEKSTEVFFKVYRGQQISRVELVKLQKSIGKNISINTYLSASTEEEVGLVYAGSTTDVLFEIDVDITVCFDNKRMSPVSTRSLSYFHDEYEVISPVGSIFRVNAVQQHNDGRHIYLKLVNKNDNEAFYQYIEKSYLYKSPPSVKFASLLILIGDLEKAEGMLQMLMEDLQMSYGDLNMRCNYDFMGQIWCARGEYAFALSWIQLNIVRQALSYSQLETQKSPSNGWNSFKIKIQLVHSEDLNDSSTLILYKCCPA